MSESLSTPTPTAAMSRRKLRLDRQARVGLLRNPNQPPKPPLRRASLMGKWLNLRSSRRAQRAAAGPKAPPPAALDETAYFATHPLVGEGPPKRAEVSDMPRAAELPEVGDPVTPQAEAAVEGSETLSLDIEKLMASVEDLGSAPPPRSAYGSDMRPDMAPQRGSSERAQGKPSILSAAAWIDDEDELTPPEPALRSEPMTDPAAARNAQASGLSAPSRMLQTLFRLGVLTVFLLGGCLIGLWVLLLF
ncbi:hypothetical protein [Pararhodobacter oceanensis]|uniref:hypothetical protein n=1 Tax=Pararhodobacter oceanensis TaxID=2172121 RepID=UPI003A908A40